jgi:ketosteroid isomerase-like protein
MPDDPATAATIDTINRFNDAFARHDVDGIMALTAPDSVFESTGPAPDGGRFEGHDAIRAVW